VLRILLLEYPEQLTIEELRREVAGADADFGELDEVNRAIETLKRTGLVHGQGLLVWPSRAARYFQALELD
jgi:hypothetical protein